MSQTLGEKLRQARKNCGMTQDQLAQSLPVSRQTISSWENNRTEPDYETLKRLAELLNVSFLGDESEEVAAPVTEEICVEAAVEEITVASKETAPPRPCFRRRMAMAMLAMCLLAAGIAGYAHSIRLDAPSLEWFLEETAPVENQAFLQLIPGETPVNAYAYPAGTPPRWNTRIYLRETGGVGITVRHIALYLFEKSWTGSTRAASEYVYTDFDILHQMGDRYIGAEQIRMIICNVTANTDTIGAGIRIETVDDNGNEQTFRLYIPFKMEM